MGTVNKLRAFWQEAKTVQLPRMRLTLREIMALLVFASLLMGWVAYRERLKLQAYRVRNQDITVRSAEANYRNAGLAREAAEDAIARHEKECGQEHREPTLRALKDAVQKARRRELDLERVWRTEKDTLSGLISELYHSWR